MPENTYVSFDETPSPLDVLEHSYGLLIAGPRPLVVNGRMIAHGLPGRLVSVAELTGLMPTMTPDGRDAVWRELLRLARTGKECWTVVCAGLALPGLRTAAGSVVAGHACDRDDVDADVLAGFVVALRQIDPGLPRVCGRLRQAAYNAGRRGRWAEVAYTIAHVHDDEAPQAMAPPCPVSHPDVVLARAVSHGALTGLEAELIGRVYLEDRPITRVAAELGLPRTTAQDRLRAAVQTFISWLGARPEPWPEEAQGMAR